MKKVSDSTRFSSVIRVMTPADRVLFIFLVGFVILCFYFVNRMPSSGDTVEVRAEDKTAYILSLDDDRIVAVKGPRGDSLIEVKDGKVSMKNSPCPGKLCVHQGWTDRGVIACLPNRVLVTVSGAARVTATSGYDAVTK